MYRWSTNMVSIWKGAEMTDNGKQRIAIFLQQGNVMSGFRKIDSVSMSHRQIEVHQQIINVKMLLLP